MKLTDQVIMKLNHPTGKQVRLLTFSGPNSEISLTSNHYVHLMREGVYLHIACGQVMLGDNFIKVNSAD